MRAAILIAAICYSALALTACTDPARPTSVAEPTSIVAASTAGSTPQASTVSTATPSPTPVRNYAPSGIYVIDARTGKTAQSFTDYRPDAERPLARPRSESEELILPLARTALWTFQPPPGRDRDSATGTLRLRRLDGSLIAEWRDAANADPSSSDDGKVLLVRLEQGWTLVRGERSDVVLSTEQIAVTGLGYTGALNRWVSPQLSPDGRWIAYLERLGPALEYRLRLLDLRTATDEVVAPVRSCQCGASFAPNWTADGAAIVFLDTQDGSITSYTYAITSRQITRLPPGQWPLLVGEVATGATLQSPDGTLIAEFVDHRVVVRTAVGVERSRSEIEIGLMHL